MNNRNRDLLAGETMFDYLRKKKMAVLEKTLNRSKAGNASDFGSSRLDQTDASVDY